MTPDPPIATILIIIATSVVSFLAFKDNALKSRLIFSPRAILADKEYYRVVTSAFLHADWQHLFFNMISLGLFGQTMEPVVGIERFVLIYFAGIIGGSLLSLYLHRHHEYFALGASGGVCGIVFSSIFLFPGESIGALFLPFGIPGWLYAMLFLGSEFYGGRRQQTNIGHDAHLGGAIIGLLTATALFPEIVRWSPWLYAMVVVLTLGMFVYFWKNPLNLPLANRFGRESAPREKLRKSGPNAEKVDAVLEKVSREGIQSLTKRERDILEKASRK
jgi:membrane associated rhomboid family serine protease